MLGESFPKMKPKLSSTAEANAVAPISLSILLLEYKMHFFALSSLFHLSAEVITDSWSQLALIFSQLTHPLWFVDNLTSLHIWSNNKRRKKGWLFLSPSLSLSVWPCRLDTSNWGVKLVCALGASSRLQPSLSPAPGLGTPGFYSAITGPGLREGAPAQGHTREHAVWLRGWTLWLCYTLLRLPIASVICHD